MFQTPEQTLAYDQAGIVFPLRALEESRATSLLPECRSLNSRMREIWTLPQYPKVHLLAPWLRDLVAHPAILDAVESILGADLLVWSSAFFAKSPRDPHYVGWHQDATYWGLEPLDQVVTAWLAFSESTTENGCMQAIGGSHRLGQLDHEQFLEDDNLLQSGQRVSFDTEGATITHVVLRPGEFSLHHSLLVHGSRGNPSERPRIGLAINYVGGEVRQTGGWDTATLVRGRDSGHFELEPAPERAFSDAAVAAFEHVLEAPSGLGRAAKLAAQP